MTDLHRQLERRVAKFLGREDAMLFNSGFGGALGTISGLLRKTDVAILDNRSHLSLRDGAVLSRSRVDRFEHNDPASLDAALCRRKGKRQLVIVEGIYSMDGDFASLDGLLDAAESHHASVFIDEAHSMLACGAHGRGAAEHFGVEKRIRLIYGTFSKAFGALGGFVAGPVETLDYLRFYAHPYAYSCALPPVIVAAVLKSLEIAEAQPHLRGRLWENASYFREQLRVIGIDTGASTTYIMPLVVGDWARTYQLGHLARTRSLGRAGGLSGRASRSDLLPRLCNGQSYARGSGRSAQHPRGHAGSDDAAECLNCRAGWFLMRHRSGKAFGRRSDLQGA